MNRQRTGLARNEELELDAGRDDFVCVDMFDVIMGGLSTML